MSRGPGQEASGASAADLLQQGHHGRQLLDVLDLLSVGVIQAPELSQQAQQLRIQKPVEEGVGSPGKQAAESPVLTRCPEPPQQNWVRALEKEAFWHGRLVRRSEVPCLLSPCRLSRTQNSEGHMWRQPQVWPNFSPVECEGLPPRACSRRWPCSVGVSSGSLKMNQSGCGAHLWTWRGHGLEPGTGFGHEAVND